MDQGPVSLKYRYLDASALVKLYVDEPDSPRLRQFVNDNPKPFQTTLLCFGEAIGVLKRKWVKEELTDAEYVDAIQRITVAAWGKTIEVQNYGTFDPFIQKEVARLIQAYRIDASDALQLLTIRDGVHSRMVDDSASVLITADKGLEKAAKAEGVRVWNCADGPPPPWA